MVSRYFRLERAHLLGEEWERWFVDVEESHTSLPALVFFRSPQPDHAWVTAAGAVLDGASLVLSSVDIPRDVQADFCIRAGYLCLRRIADFFRIPHDPDPAPDDPISVTREEWDDIVRSLADEGVPIKRDLEQAWRDFAGWRVNYDRVCWALRTSRARRRPRGRRIAREIGRFDPGCSAAPCRPASADHEPREPTG